MSTQRRIYLDWNASAPLAEPARRAMITALPELANPSSLHGEGRLARDRVERARHAVARLIGRPREHVVFTSGGTEANALGVLALADAAERRGLPRVVASAAVDHPSLRGAVAALVRRGWTAAALPVDHDGRVRPGDRAVGVVAVGHVNHELGTVLDPSVASWARGAGALVHVDAVQAAGKLALAELDADAIAISAHKIGGPQGVGALAIALDDGLPVIAAGHQERGRRPGTENVVGIVGFAAAAEAVDLAAWPAVAALGAALEAGLLAGPLAPFVRIHGARAPRVGGTINVGFAGARGQDVMIALDLAGIAVATGAACASGSLEPSPVLLALGLSREQALEAVRFSLGPTTTAAEIEEAVRAVVPLVERARSHR